MDEKSEVEIGDHGDSDEPETKKPHLQTEVSDELERADNGVDILKRRETVEYDMDVQQNTGTENGRFEADGNTLKNPEVDNDDCGEPEAKKPRLDTIVSTDEQVTAVDDHGSLQRKDTVEYDMGIQNPELEHKRSDAHGEVSDVNGGTTQDSEPPKVPENKEVSEIPVSLSKIPSVLQDAELIAGIVDGYGISEIYEKLKEIRGNPNRVDIVINQILETAGHLVKEHQTDKSSALLGDFVKVIDKAMANMETLPVSADEIHNLLRMEGDKLDRVDRVVSKLLTKYYNSVLPGEKTDLRGDVRHVLQKLPGANPDEVYILLRERVDLPDRVPSVINFLQARTVAKLTRKDTLPEDPSLRNDPLYRDMRIVAKVLPDVDPNEIYAFLEAFHDQKNRIQLVIEEMMKIVPISFSQESDGDVSSVSGSLDSQVENVPVGVKIAYNIDDEVQDLQEIFPDCDPKYLYDELEKKQDDRERVKNIAMAMFENKDYPKRDEVAEEKKKLQVKERIENLKFDMSDFLSKFPNPVEAFEKNTKKMNNNYIQHVMIQIYNDFKEYKKGFLTHIMSKLDFRYIPSKKKIKKKVKDIPDDSNKIKRDPRKEEAFPNDPDEFFFYEKLYSAHEQEIKDFLEEQERMRELHKEQARENGEFLECGCCFDDECLFEDMSSCADGHVFCKECIRRSAEVVIGSSLCDFPCLADKCEYKFPLPVLQMVLPANMFSILLRRMQEEEIKQADIPDLVSCPFCSFATIMTNPEDKVFKCLNPECLKDSCRLCHEPNHIPKRCSEVEKQGETNLRTYIETKVSEAMLRRCPKCKRYFFKEYGCNKMSCVCGMSMCYVCRKPDIDYDHFDEDENIAEENRCGLYADVHKVHYKEMLEAAEEAKKMYIEEHPDAEDMVNEYDLDEHLRGMKERIIDEEEEDYPEPADDDRDDYGSGDELSTDNEENWRDDSDYDESSDENNEGNDETENNNESNDVTKDDNERNDEVKDNNEDVNDESNKDLNEEANESVDKGSNDDVNNVSNENVDKGGNEDANIVSNEGTDKGGNEGTDKGGNDDANNVSNEGTDKGGNEGTDKGGNEGTDKGGNEGTDKGGNEGTDKGVNEDGNDGSNEGTDKGGNEGTDKGGNEGTDKGGNEDGNDGSNEGTDKGGNEGTDKGGNEDGNDGSNEGTDKGGNEGTDKGGNEDGNDGSNEGTDKNSNDNANDCSIAEKEHIN